MRILRKVKHKLVSLATTAVLALSLMAGVGAAPTQVAKAAEVTPTVVPHDHTHDSSWKSWEQAIAAGDIEIYSGANVVFVKKSVNVYLTSDMQGYNYIEIRQNDIDFSLCLNGYSYTLTGSSQAMLQCATSGNDISIVNCKQSGKIGSDGFSYYGRIFNIANGNITFSGVTMDLSNGERNPTMLEIKKGEILVENSSINFNGTCFQTYHTSQDEEFPITIKNSTVNTTTGTAITGDGVLTMDGCIVSNNAGSGRAVASSKRAYISNCQIDGTVNITGTDCEISNVDIKALWDENGLSWQPSADNCTLDVSDCTITGANYEYKKGILMSGSKEGHTCNISNVVINGFDNDIQTPSQIIDMNITDIPEGEKYVLYAGIYAAEDSTIFTSSEDISDSLSLGNGTGYSLACEPDGTGYRYYYKALGIDQQPTATNPTVGLSSEKGATYQWYAGSKEKLVVSDTSGEGYIEGKTSLWGTSLECVNDYWKPKNSYGSTYYYAGFDIKNGDVVTLDFTAAAEGYLYIQNSRGVGEYDHVETDKSSHTYTFNEDMSGMGIMFEAYGSTVPDIKVTVVRANLGDAVEGQTTKTLTGVEPGSYMCKVTWADGTVVFSDSFIIGESYQIEVPTTTNGTAKVNSSAVEGQTVTVETTPAKGYKLDDIVVTDASGNDIPVEISGNDGTFTMPAGAVSVTVTFAVDESQDPAESGDIKIESSENNDCKATLEDTDKIAAVVPVTPEEQVLIDAGEDMSIILEFEEVGTGADTAEKKAIEEKLGDKKVGAYLDIELIKKIGNITTNITATNSEISISFVVPDSLINTDTSVTREYFVIRNHNGKIEVLDTKFDATKKAISFKTDKFSTYALAYVDKATTNEAPSTEATTEATTEAPSTETTTQAPSTEATTQAPSTGSTTDVTPTTEAPTTEAPNTDKPVDGPTTGDQVHLSIIIVLMMICAVGLCIVKRLKGYEVE